MKNFEQLIGDIKSNEELKSKFSEELNKIRSEKSLEIQQQVLSIVKEFGYEISDDESKKFFAALSPLKIELSDDELDAASGGAFLDCLGAYFPNL